MNKIIFLLQLIFLFIRCNPKDNIPDTYLSDDNITPVPFHKVKLTDSFWKPRMITQAKNLVPFALDKTSPAVENLIKTGNYLKGDTSDLPFAHRYISSDLYKVMEGAAYLLMNNRNPVLEQRLDTIIDIIGEAQRDDGYLYVAHITGVSKNHDHWGGGGMGDKPYSFVVHSHELYNMGHMYEAAVAYYNATGKDKWLRIAEKNAQHINKVFFEGDPNFNDGKPVNQAPGHQEIELGLIKLFRVTGNELYLQMAKKFIDIRGVTYIPNGDQYLSPTYAQQHLPVANQTSAVGHAVRATYQYAAMAEIGALVSSNDYDEALQLIWSDITDKKMHITGGLGAMHGIEGFGEEYELPNKEAYNETCAAVGNVFFNYRMFLQTHDAKYIDVGEVALYNNALAGVNLEGNRFFYVNPLETDGITPFNHGKTGRSPWFNTACCPSNIARLIPQVSGMMYATSKNEIYSLLYGSNTTIISLNNVNISINQKTAYPFEGNISFSINPEEELDFSLKLRIPTWSDTDQFVPGDLYKYMNTNDQIVLLKVNGKDWPIEGDKGFVIINRKWKAGDEVQLILPMNVNFSQSHEKVTANNNRIAITRGPLVYCAEGIDNDGNILDAIIDYSQINSSVEYFNEGILKGIPAVILQSETDTAKLKKNAKMIPYYAWNNRGDGQMIVWMNTN